jgi:outer membrane protein
MGQVAPDRLPLNEAFQRALRQHPALARSHDLTGAAAARVTQARSGALPSLEFQGAATNGPAGAPAFGLRGLAGDPLKKHYGSGLNLFYTLFDFGRTQYLVSSRKFSEGAAREDEETQKASVLLGVQAAYLNVLRTQQLAEVQKDNVRQREETARQAQLFADSGLKADIDAQLAKANLAEARTALIAAQNDVKTAFAALNSSMGDTKLTEYQLESPSVAAPVLPSQIEIVKQAVANRPELLGSQLQIRAAEQSIRAARSDLLPRIDGIASAGALTPSKLITDNKPYAVGVSATFPLYTGGLVEGRVAEEKQKRATALDAEREIEEAVKLQATKAWLNVQTRAEQVKSTKEQLAASESSLKQASERYRLQLNTFVEVVTAEAIATRARAQMVDATYDLELAKAELDWATGTTYKKYSVPKKPK